MTRILILTPALADKVRGLSPSKDGHALIPVEMEDGFFKLGEGVLDLPAFAHAREILASLPRSDDRPAKALSDSEMAADEPLKLRVWSADVVQKRGLAEAEPTKETAAGTLDAAKRG